jgi:hypothetical protein
MVGPGSADRSVRAGIHRLVTATGSDAVHRLGRLAWRPGSRFVTRGARLSRPFDRPRPVSRSGGPCGPDPYRARPASRFTVTAMMNAPNRYDTIECRSTVRRISLLVRLVSEIWNVVPMVNATYAKSE